MQDMEKLYGDCYKPVYAFLLSLCRDPALAEELTQETLFRGILNYDGFRGDCDLRVWLCQIGKNLFYEYSRRHKNRLPLREDIPDGEEPEERLADRDSARRILEEVHRLEEPYKEVFLLHVLGDVPLKEISRLFGKSESWARVTYYRAKARLLEQQKEGKK